jgi:2-deoxy-D-gluconate 3-dehydrogenase
MDINLTSAFICSKAAYFEMRKTGGKIINVGSMASVFAFAYGAPYTASKGGMVQLTKALAVAWAKDNIQVNAILPGWFYTELMDRNKDGMPGLERKVLGRTPAGRWGTMADLAGVCIFLAGAASDFVTGTAIPVDGGYAAQGFSDD